MLICAILKFLSISRSLVSLLFFPFRISITFLSISVILFCCSLPLLPFVSYMCFATYMLYLYVYVFLIDLFVIFNYLFIFSFL